MVSCIQLRHLEDCLDCRFHAVKKFKAQAMSLFFIPGKGNLEVIPGMIGITQFHLWRARNAS